MEIYNSTFSLKHQTSQLLNCLPLKPSPTPRWIKDWLKCQAQGCLVVCPRGRLAKAINSFINELHTGTELSPSKSAQSKSHEECLTLQMLVLSFRRTRQAGKLGREGSEGNAQSSIWRGITPRTITSQECTLMAKKGSSTPDCTSTAANSCREGGHPSPLLSTAEGCLLCCCSTGLTSTREM